MRGWLALIAAVVLLVLTFVSVKFYRDAQRLEENGLWTKATIIDRWINYGDESDSYHARFFYEVPGVSYKQDRNVGSSYYREHHVGEVVDIKYWSVDPSLFEFKEGQMHTSARWIQIAALVTGIAGCGLLWYAGSRANSAVLSRRRGERTTATIMDFIERKNSGKPTGRGYMKLETEDGKRGESLDHDINKLLALGRGNRVVVYVRGNDVWWEGDVGPRQTHESRIPTVE